MAKRKKCPAGKPAKKPAIWKRSKAVREMRNVSYRAGFNKACDLIIERAKTSAILGDRIGRLWTVVEYVESVQAAIAALALLTPSLAAAWVLSVTPTKKAYRPVERVRIRHNAYNTPEIEAKDKAHVAEFMDALAEAADEACEFCGEPIGSSLSCPTCAEARIDANKRSPRDEERLVRGRTTKPIGK
jgi:hypothetical protein